MLFNDKLRTKFSRWCDIIVLCKYELPCMCGRSRVVSCLVWYVCVASFLCVVCVGMCVCVASFSCVAFLCVTCVVCVCGMCGMCGIILVCGMCGMCVCVASFPAKSSPRLLQGNRPLSKCIPGVFRLLQPQVQGCLC